MTLVIRIGFDRILELVAEGWRRYPMFRLGQFLEIVAETHELGAVPDYELERRLKDPSRWQGPPPAAAKPSSVG
jgi:hypothetical protein